MVYRRLIYLALLVAAFIFQITSESYLGQFTFVVAIALPVLSVLLSLPAMLSCRPVLTTRSPRVTRGEGADWQLLLEVRSPLPLARLSLRLTERNPFTGQTWRHSAVLRGGSGEPVLLAADTEHCGFLELSAAHVRALDYLGLFSLRRPVPEPVHILVAPLPAGQRPVPLPEGGGVHVTPTGAARKGSGEDYDLREYRPGDPLRSVHWKLSSKWDELIVKERMESPTPMPLLTFDRDGDPDSQDRIMDKLEARCRFLLTAGRPFAVLWLDGNGKPSLHRVGDEKEREDCLLAALSSPLPPAGADLDTLPRLIELAGEPIFRLPLTAGEDDNYG